MEFERGFKNVIKRKIELNKYLEDSFVLKYSEDCIVLINEERKNENNIIIIKSDNLCVVYPENTPKRSLKIKKDKRLLIAEAEIKYESIKIKEIVEKFEKGILTISLEETEEVLDSPKYTRIEIKEIINSQNINYGVLEEGINAIIDGNERAIIAKGVLPIDDEEDTVKLLIKMEDSNGKNKIDYRNRKNIAMVKKDDVIANIIIGKIGKDGINIEGEKIKKRDKRKLDVKCNDGCYIQNNEIISKIDGKVEYKKNIFKVVKVLELNKNINMESGNINFVGSLLINGNVDIGMTVVSGESLVIKGNCENATLICKKEGILEGNIIGSKILIGMKDEKLLIYFENLCKFKEEIENLINFLNQFDTKCDMGNLVKVIIEKKLPGLPKLALSILSYKNENEFLLNLIKSKIIGMGPLNIKSINELKILLKIIERECIKINKELDINANLYLDYAQDTEINCVGNVTFTGKGEYISNIIAEGNVIFLNENAVARGGSISAKNIKCGIVGSPGGSKTILKVNEAGTIEIKIAYRNTNLIIGKKNITIEEDSKDVKVYMKNGELEIEKIIL